MVNIFGPIPSRRLGWSLGVNVLPEKICTYSCRYCQVGVTRRYDTVRREYANPAALSAAVAAKVEAVRANGGTAEVVSFVPDGEPTLDALLGEEIVAVKRLGLPVAVITNGSLMDRADVRNDLLAADIVSVKIDATDEQIWRRLDAPDTVLSLAPILEGIGVFAGLFAGKLLTETMLVGGVNDGDASLTATARFIAGLRPHKSYLLVPTRPPAYLDLVLPAPDRLAAAWRLFTTCVGSDRVELLTGHEGNAFSSTGDPRADILAITAVHPLRIENVQAILASAGASWEIVETLEREGLVAEVSFGDERFLVRTLHHHFSSEESA